MADQVTIGALAASALAMAVAEKEKGDVHGRVDCESLGSSLHRVGYCLTSTGGGGAARPWFERAVAEKEKGDVQGRVDHESLGRSLHQVGCCLASTGEFGAARPWFERAVAEKEKGDVHGRVEPGQESALGGLLPDEHRGIRYRPSVVRARCR